MILLVKSVNRLVNNSQEGNSGMVDRRRDKDYIRKVIRISQNYIVLCDFLDFYSNYKEKNKFEFYNDLIIFYVKYLVILAINLKNLPEKFMESPDHFF
jgi:hypothetical protein